MVTKKNAKKTTKAPVATYESREEPDTNMDAMDAFLNSEPSRVEKEESKYMEEPDRESRFDSLRQTRERGPEPIERAKFETSIGGLFQKKPSAPRRIPMSVTIDPEVYELIERAADAHRVSKSQVVEKIMKEVLAR